VMDSEIMGLPPTSFETGLAAFVVTPWTGVYREELRGEWLRQHLLLPKTGVPSFVPAPVPHQYLRPWCREDEDLLNLSESGVAAWN